MAALVTGINAILTGIKFLLYYSSGSMAILAEAWHSFADIGTSLLVFIALLSEKARPESEDKMEGPLPKKYTELAISMGIGLMLTGVSFFLIYSFFTSGHRQIDNSLVSGLIFLLFSFISYAVYRFETRLGERVGSIGLISDGMHSRADMAASLITGFALILYTMGLDLDRWVSLAIALFVLSFAIETVMNVIGEFYRKDGAPIRRYSFHEAFFVLFDKQTFQRNATRIKGVMAVNIPLAKLLKNLCKVFLILVPAIIIASFLNSVFFTIAPHERAVVERFGAPFRHHESISPGIHVKWPWPVDRVIKVDVTRVKSMNIGNISDGRSAALLWTKSHGSEEPFLTGDNNLFYPYIVVDYRIGDITTYLYRSSNPEENLNEAAHRIATRTFSREKFYDIASTKRSELAAEMSEELQASMTALETGIDIVNINLRDIHPPISVAEAFERVIAGYQEKQKLINDAMGYRYNIIPRSRGTAAETMEEATGYVVQRVNSAQGDSRRFIMSMPDSEEGMAVATTRRHLDTVSEALKNRKKIVIDPKIGTTNIWMSYDETSNAENQKER